MRRDFALSLNPVSFRYHKQYDASQTIAFGLIAEEVAEVNPDLVGRNPEGQPRVRDDCRESVNSRRGYSGARRWAQTKAIR